MGDNQVMGDKRKRSPNWLSSEKYLLLDIVQKHFSVVENKKNRFSDNEAENYGMGYYERRIQFSDNKFSQNGREPKSQWESMKKAVKKESSKLRMHIIQTGGGPPKPKIEDPFYNRILGLIEPSVVGLHNPFDNDAPDSGFHSQNTMSQSTEYQGSDVEAAHVNLIETGPPVPDCNPVLRAVKKTDEIEAKVIEVGSPVRDCTSESDPVAKKNPDWGNYTPRLLKKPVSNNLRLETNSIEKKKGISKRRPVLQASSLDLLYNNKVEAIVAQRGHADDKRREANSLYKINMQIKEEELKIKREELKQNKIKTRLLLLELRLKKKNIKQFYHKSFVLFSNTGVNIKVW